MTDSKVAETLNRKFQNTRIHPKLSFHPSNSSPPNFNLYNIAPKNPASPIIIPPAPTMISLFAPFFPVAVAAAELAVLLAVLTTPPSAVVAALPLLPVVVASVVCTAEDTDLEIALVATEV